MEQRLFAGITVGILLLSSLLLYFNEDNEQDEQVEDNEQVEIGQNVAIMSTRPISKTKSWRLVTDTIKKGK